MDIGATVDLVVDFPGASLANNPSTAVSILLRDDERWWKGEPTTVSLTRREVSFAVSGLDWYSVYGELDDADDGGEFSLSISSTPSSTGPDLTYIQGVGLYIDQVWGPADAQMVVKSLTIDASGPTRAREWTLYE